MLAQRCFGKRKKQHHHSSRTVRLPSEPRNDCSKTSNSFNSALPQKSRKKKSTTTQKKKNILRTVSCKDILPRNQRNKKTSPELRHNRYAKPSCVSHISSGN